MNKKELIKYLVIMCILFLLLALTLFNQTSFWFIGMSIVIIGLISLFYINQN